MKYAVLVTLAAALCLPGKDKKGEEISQPAQTSNDQVQLDGTLLLGADEIQQALGTDLGPGYLVVQMKVTAKNDADLHIASSDFMLLSHKNGDRCEALEPGRIAGRGELVVKPAAQQPGGDGTRTNGPIWGGVTARLGNRGTGAKDSDKPAPKMDKNAGGNPLLTLLKQKILPDQETKTSIAGLLYFQLDGKLKPKDVSLIYQGQAGKLIMDFK